MKKSLDFISIHFLWVFLLINTSLVSQNTNQKDSLARYTFEELSNKFYAVKPDSLLAIMYAKYIIKKARKKKDTLELANGYYFLSDITKDSTYFVSYWGDIIKATKNTNNRLYPAISYLELGDFYFHKTSDINKALKNYLLVQKNTKNDSLKYVSIHRIALQKSSYNKNKEAINLFKEVYSYYKTQKNTDNNVDYISLLVNISIEYYKIKQYDSAVFYNEKAYQIGLNHNNKDIFGYTIFMRGRLNYSKKKFSLAIIDFKKSIPFILNDESYSLAFLVYKYIAVSYYKLKKFDKTIEYYKKIDSLKSVTNIVHKSQKSAFKYLINHYKKEGDSEKQLEYINKYIKVDSVLNVRDKNIAKNLTENYDIPNLLAEKKLIEDRLKNKLSTFEKWIWSISLFSVIILIFLIIQYRKRKLYKERFKKLLEKPIRKYSTNKISVKKENSIPKETIEALKKQLLEFETKHQFISTEVSLSSLAKLFNTNTKYLSQVINQEKGQSFNNYINQLRINYTVEKLKTDTRFRKYSVKAIAHEVGFNTTESFSKAFFKFTGIKPSYFIKELESL